jgi:hypothetical protein
MAVLKMMYSVIDTQTGDRLAFSDAPNATVTLPDGGIAQFSQLGQIEPGHAPRYKLVEAHIESEPDYPFVVTGETRQFVNGRDEIARTYVPDASAYQRAIEAQVEGVAAERGYSSAVSCASYVSSTNPVWQAEAGAFVTWRDAVWAYAFEQLALVQAGEREKPSIAEFITELPAIEWPE